MGQLSMPLIRHRFATLFCFFFPLSLSLSPCVCYLPIVRMNLSGLGIRGYIFISLFAPILWLATQPLEQYECLTIFSFFIIIFSPLVLFPTDSRFVFIIIHRSHIDVKVVYFPSLFHLFPSIPFHFVLFCFVYHAPAGLSSFNRLFVWNIFFSFIFILLS